MKKALYSVLCFRGYHGIGTRQIIEFEPKLKKANIIHLMERVPKPFVDEYDIEKTEQTGEDRDEENQRGYCNLGLIIEQQDAERVRELLASKGKKENEDFFLCPVMQGHEKLERLVQTWEDVFILKKARKASDI